MGDRVLTAYHVGRIRLPGMSSITLVGAKIVDYIIGNPQELSEKVGLPDGMSLSVILDMD